VLNDLESRHIKPLPEPGAIDFLSLDSLKKVVIFCLDILPHYFFVVVIDRNKQHKVTSSASFVKELF